YYGERRRVFHGWRGDRDARVNLCLCETVLHVPLFIVVVSVHDKKTVFGLELIACGCHCVRGSSGSSLFHIFYLAVDFPSVAKPFSNRFTLESDHQYDLTNPCIRDGFDCPFYYRLVINRKEGLWSGLGGRRQHFASVLGLVDGIHVRLFLCDAGL